MSELTISFTSGQWNQLRHGESGPPAYEAGGGGGEVRGWLEGGDTDTAWDDVTHAFAGLFCATVGAEHVGESVRTFGDLYPPARQGNSEFSFLARKTDIRPLPLSRCVAAPPPLHRKPHAVPVAPSVQGPVWSECAARTPRQRTRLGLQDGGYRCGYAL